MTFSSHSAQVAIWPSFSYSRLLSCWLRAWPEAAKVVRRPPRLRWMPIGIHDGVMLLPMGQSFIAQDCHAIISTCWLAGLRAWPEALEVVSSGCRSFRLSWMRSRVYARVLLLEQYLRRLKFRINSLLLMDISSMVKSSPSTSSLKAPQEWFSVLSVCTRTAGTWRRRMFA